MLSTYISNNANLLSFIEQKLNPQLHNEPTKEELRELANCRFHDGVGGTVDEKTYRVANLFILAQTLYSKVDKDWDALPLRIASMAVEVHPLCSAVAEEIFKCAADAVCKNKEHVQDKDGKGWMIAPNKRSKCFHLIQIAKAKNSLGLDNKQLLNDAENIAMELKSTFTSGSANDMGARLLTQIESQRCGGQGAYADFLFPKNSRDSAGNRINSGSSDAMLVEIEGVLTLVHDNAVATGINVLPSD